jgi:hypothetical protein
MQPNPDDARPEKFLRQLMLPSNPLEPAVLPKYNVHIHGCV